MKSDAQIAFPEAHSSVAKTLAPGVEPILSDPPDVTIARKDAPTILGQNGVGGGGPLF